MWESRYRVRVKDPGEFGMMMAESGYIDANPVNVGIVDELARANRRPDLCGKCYAAGLEITWGLSPKSHGVCPLPQKQERGSEGIRALRNDQCLPKVSRGSHP